MREPAKIVQFVEMVRRTPLPPATAFAKLRQEQRRLSRSMGVAVTGFAIPPNSGKVGTR
jgi:hypothetical protein